QHLDTTDHCGVGNIGTDCVWAYDNLSRQIVATQNADGSWTVTITDNGSFAGFADPVSGAALASNGPVKGTYQLTVVSSGPPDGANLPAQVPGDMHTTDMIKQLFGDLNAQVTGGPYSYSYQNGAYVQDTNGTHGDVRGH